MLNDRRQRVLRLLLSTREDVSAAEIGQTLACPARSIRYDLSAIGQWVERHGASMVGTAGIGYRLEGDLGRVREECDRLAQSEVPVYEYVLSPRERVRRMLLLLLGEERPRSLQSLADRLGVAKSTVHTDLDTLQGWVAARGLILERNHGGLRLLGAEVIRRQAMADLVAELADEGQLATLLDGAPEAHALLALLRPMLPEVDWVALGAVAREAGSPDLAVYLSVMVSRLATGHALSLTPDHIARVAATPEWQRARVVADRVEEACRIRIPPEEVANLAVVLEGARTGAEDLTALPEASLGMARALAGLVQTHLGMPLAQDPEFVMGLALHLKPVQHRLQRGLAVENPLLDEVCAKYPMALRVAQDVAAVLEAAWHTLVPPAEVGYVAIHIAAAIERAKLREPRGLRALLVCGTGVGTAQLLATRLRGLVPEVQVGRVTSALRVRDVMAAEQFDVVITTVQLAPCPLPVVRVSPLLTEGDVGRLRRILNDMQNRSGRGRPPVLKDVLTRDRIALDCQAATWEEAVRRAGGLLTATGAVEERYVEAMVNTARELGPYIVLGPGFALPHARPEAGVRQVAIAMVRLARPVCFGHPENDPVDLVFALGAIDHETHLKALMQLSELLGNPDSLEGLRKANTVDAVLELVNSVSAVEI